MPNIRVSSTSGVYSVPGLARSFHKICEWLKTEGHLRRAAVARPGADRFDLAALIARSGLPRRTIADTLMHPFPARRLAELRSLSSLNIANILPILDAALDDVSLDVRRFATKRITAYFTSLPAGEPGQSGSGLITQSELDHILCRAFNAANRATAEQLLPKLAERKAAESNFSLDLVFDKLIAISYQSKDPASRIAACHLLGQVSENRIMEAANQLETNILLYDSSPDVRSTAKTVLLGMPDYVVLRFVSRHAFTGDASVRRRFYQASARLASRVSQRRDMRTVRTYLIREIELEVLPQLLYFLLSREIGITDQAIKYALQLRLHQPFNHAIKQAKTLLLWDSELAEAAATHSEAIVRGLLNLPPTTFTSTAQEQAVDFSAIDAVTAQFLAEAIKRQGWDGFNIGFTTEAKESITPVEAASLVLVPFHTADPVDSTFKPLTAILTPLKESNAAAIICPICQPTILPKQVVLISDSVQLSVEEDRVMRRLECVYLAQRALEEIESGVPVNQRLAFYDREFSTGFRLVFTAYMNVCRLARAI
ncbi:MAG: hypothetical protein QME05_03640 [Candidatus Margulisbacteria bacterium]|nr:hypothetical protein [Candidatus Margulisiibacteriota bacterium]